MFLLWIYVLRITTWISICQIIKKLIERKQTQIRKVYPGLTCFKEGVRQIPVESIPGISESLVFLTIKKILFKWLSYFWQVSFFQERPAGNPVTRTKGKPLAIIIETILFWLCLGSRWCNIQKLWSLPFCYCHWGAPKHHKFINSTRITFLFPCHNYTLQ